MKFSLNVEVVSAIIGKLNREVCIGFVVLHFRKYKSIRATSFDKKVERISGSGEILIHVSIHI